MSQQNDFYIKKGTLYRYEGRDEEVVIPSEVRRIAPEAFINCKTIKKVAAPVRLVRLGNRAFYGCDNLAEVIIPGALFKRVKAEKIFSDPRKIYFRFYASNGLETEADDDYGAEWDAVESEVAPQEESQKKAEAEVEPAVEQPAPAGGEIVSATTLLVDVNTTEGEGEPVEEVTADIIPEEVAEEITEEADVRTLREKIDAVTPEEPLPEGLSPNRRKELLNLTDFLIEDTTLVKYIGTDCQVEIPEFITRIAENAFANSDITDIYIPRSVKYISSRAFTWCESLGAVELPEELELIDDLAFANCTALKEIVIPKSVKYIGESAFHACSSLEKLILTDGITSISRRAFDFCTSLADVAIPESVTILHDGAFAHCESLKSVRLSSGLKKIANWAFAECTALTDFDLPEGLEEIGDVAFMNCRALKRVAMPESVRRLGRQCYVNCTGLILILLPEHLRDQVKPQKVFQGVSGVDVEYV